MASTSPSPNSSPTAIPPSSPNSSTTTPPPTLSQPNQTSETPPPSNSSTPSVPSAPPPQSPPPVVPAAPPPSPPAATPPPTLSPPPLPSPPPPSSPTSPPPSLPATPRPTTNSPPPPILSPRPPLTTPPPQESPAPPVVTPPPPLAVSPAPPPPLTEVPVPPTSDPPPAPLTKPPANSPPPPVLAPPPSGSPPTPTPPSVSSPPPVPSSSLRPPMSPPGPSSNSSVNRSSPSSPLPTFPTEKPTARSTPGPNITANAAPKNSKGLNSGGAVAIGIVVSFFVLSLVVMTLWFARRRKRKGSDSNGGYIMPSPFASSQHSDSSFFRPQRSIHHPGSASGSNLYSPEQGGVGNSRSWFTYEELAEATYGFSATNLLGEGGFGCVYKGFLADGREVAVKQLKIGGGQGEREFRAEVEIISRVHHRHLVSLVGYCISDHQRLLVYDYVSNNTLDYHLHGEGRPVMDWATRVKVAAGAARGLAYLHEDCHPRIIHRDIKSSNILLDDNFDAQVADFGLAKLALDANTHVTTRVMGTFGYMAPEYASSGKLTEKSDVFSFGVVLLELITGRKPVDTSQPLGDESLVEWARPELAQALDKQDFEELVDPRLEKNYVEHEVFRMIEAAAACVRHLATKRPRMSQVVRALDSMFEFSDLTNGVKPGQSEIYDSREQSAQIRMFQRMAFGSQDYNSTEFFNHSHSSWRS